MTTALHDIADYRVGLPEGWHPMPLDADGETWPEHLASELVATTAERRSLEQELRRARESVISMDDAMVRAAVWIDAPESGSASALMVFTLADLAETGTPDDYERFLAAYATADDADGLFYSVSTWRSAVEAGEVVGSHNLIAHADEEGEIIGSYLEERVVIAVFPPRAAQCVQFIFSAQGLGSFRNAAEESQAMVAGLELRLDAAL